MIGDFVFLGNSRNRGTLLQCKTKCDPQKGPIFYTHPFCSKITKLEPHFRCFTLTHTHTHTLAQNHTHAHTHTHKYTHTHIRVKVLKWGDHPSLLHLDTLGPRFFNLAFLNLYDRQLYTELRSYQTRYKVCVEICTIRKMFTDVLKFMKENFEVYKF